MKIAFLLTHVPDPRMNKRIKELKKENQVTVFCVRRKSSDIWDPVFTDIKYIILDEDLPVSQKIGRRLFSTFKVLRRMFEFLKNNSFDILYADGFEALLAAAKYKQKNSNIKVIYEVADIREIFLVKNKGKIKRSVINGIKNLEKKSFKNVDGLVITSEEFYNKYYYKLITKEKVLFIPNIPDVSVFKNYKKKEKTKFTIGFIGGIRYLNQMKMLVRCAEQAECEVVFSGAGGTLHDMNEIQNFCKDKNNVTFTGKYNYDNDIARLYSNVDCIFAVYDADNPNVQIALPNKLYEAIYCELPIIVAKDTYLDEVVTGLGVGISVSHKNDNELFETLKKLKEDKDYYDGIVDCCKESKEIINLEFYNETLKEYILNI